MRADPICISDLAISADSPIPSVHIGWGFDSILLLFEIALFPLTAFSIALLESILVQRFTVKLDLR